jgi:hypothetical protein
MSDTTGSWLSRVVVPICPSLAMSLTTLGQSNKIYCVTRRFWWHCSVKAQQCHWCCNLMTQWCHWQRQFNHTSPPPSPLIICCEQDTKSDTERCLAHLLPQSEKLVPYILLLTTVYCSKGGHPQFKSATLQLRNIADNQIDYGVAD